MIRARFAEGGWRLWLCVLLLWWSSPDASTAEIPAPEPSEIVPAGAKLERLFTRTAPVAGGLTEGPTAAPDGTIFFSDIAAGEDRGTIYRFDPRTGRTSVFAADSRKSNGLAFDLDGRLLACEGADYGGRCIARYDVATGAREVIAEGIDSKRFNSPNDLCLDAAGRVYFTDPRYVGPETRELEHRAVYRVDVDGSVAQVTREVEKPNGIALSPDGRTLYVADTNNGTDRILEDGPPVEPGAMKVYAFPLGVDGLVGGPRRTIVDFGGDFGCDGMTIDVRGNLYLAVRDPKRPGIRVVRPDGSTLAFVPTGSGREDATQGGLPSNCTFGIGVESNRLYVTAALGLYRIRLHADGFRRPNRAQTRILRRFVDEFVAIEPGTAPFPRRFRMGAEGDGPFAPAREVTMPRRFEIAAYEVPQNLWEAAMGVNPSRWKGPRNSVERLSFDDAVSFSRNATHLLRAAGFIGGLDRVRLPTEAEWEYCARAGTPTAYSFGNAPDDLGDYAWFSGNAKGNDPPVGAKRPNPWKLYDVHGYLWEWCADSWHPSYDGAPRDGSARDGDGAKRVIRGGSWKDPAAELTSFARRGIAPETLDDAVGLRCVLERSP